MRTNQKSEGAVRARAGWVVLSAPKYEAGWWHVLSSFEWTGRDREGQAMLDLGAIVRDAMLRLKPEYGCLQQGYGLHVTNDGVSFRTSPGYGCGDAHALFRNVVNEYAQLYVHTRETPVQKPN